MNELFFISTYRRGKTWLFDDKQRGIVAEPFVMGASELIQKYLDRKGMKRKRKNVPLVFSLQPFPDADVVLTCTEKLHSCEYTYEEGNFPSIVKTPISAWYIDQEGHKCWLCPAQLKFFGKVADTIYAKIG